MNTKITTLLLTALLLSTSVMADAVDDAQAEAQKKAMETTDVETTYSAKSAVDAGDVLKQSINLGFANTTGNTETLNLNGKYNMSFTTVGYAEEALKVAFDASAFLTKNENVTDNEEYVANLGVEQYITDGWLGYASLSWLRNEFRNYDNKFSVGAGLGKEIYNDGQHSFKAKLGVAYNVEQYSNGQEDEDFASLNQYLEYNYKLNKISNLYVKVGAMENFEDFSNDYEVLAVAGLNFAVAENLSVTIEEEIRYDNLPPVGFDETDTKSIVRVGYNF